MDRYMVSDNANGPWLEFTVTNLPQRALEVARSKMDWKIVWVAKMRPIMGIDVLGSPEVVWGDIMERLTVQFGGSLASQFAEDADMAEIYKHACDAVTGYLLDVESELMVPDIKKPYGVGQNTKMTDFMKTKPDLDGLIGAIR